MNSTTHMQLLEPDMIRRLGRVEMKARNLVEGFLAGLHRSSYRGFSVEFAEHRSYVPGDDPRYIDWKVYGKRERYYIKQYHEEMNFVATLLLDTSASMTFASGRISKLYYASLLAAALSYLILRQNDAVALGIYDRQQIAYLPPGTRLSFIDRLAKMLTRVEPTGRTDTDQSLAQLSRHITRKGIVIVLSDFLDSSTSILKGLKQLKFRGHEVIALHVLDPHELSFPLRGPVRFESMESNLRVLAEPHRIREAYIEALNRHLHELRQGCSRAGIDYRLTNTAEPIEEVLLKYLATRQKRWRVAR